MINVDARSIVSKLVKFELVSIGYSPHVVVVTETRLNPKIQDVEAVPPGYNIFRKGREESWGGGITIIVKNYLDCTEVQGASDKENIWCRTTRNCSEMIVGGVYRPPGAPINYLAAFNQFLVKLSCNSKKMVVAGNFNLGDINWNNLEGNTRDSMSFIGMVFSPRPSARFSNIVERKAIRNHCCI